MKTVYLGLGSNLGARERNLEEALGRLSAPDFRLRRLSSVFETEPMEVRDQPWFLNLVAEAEADLFPMQLLGRIARLEKGMGRQRQAAKGPRIIDVDILLFGRFVIDTPQLVVPHPGLAKRRFVLEPMVELAGELRHPVLRKTMRELLAGVRDQTVRRLDTKLTLKFS